MVARSQEAHGLLPTRRSSRPCCIEQITMVSDIFPGFVFPGPVFPGPVSPGSGQPTSNR